MKDHNTLIIGCGIRQVKQVKELAVAIDISQEYLDKAKKIRPDNIYIKASVEKLPFSKNKFNKVIFTHVLEHVNKPKKAIKEIYRVLAPGGILFLAVPSKEYESFLSEHNTAFKKCTEEFHKTHFDRRKLEEYLSTFKKVYIKEIKGKGIVFWYLWGKFISGFRLEDKFYIEECGQIHCIKFDIIARQFSRMIQMINIILSPFIFRNIVSEYEVIATK